MRARACLGILLLAVMACCSHLQADEGSAPDATPPAGAETPTPDRVEVPPLKTSIYVGRVTLHTTPFSRSGESWAATYDAKVFPWAFWSEHGEITITLPESDLQRLLGGEMVNFTGNARNHRGKPRQVTGRATPDGSHGGRIKVRIEVDGVELVFNGDYALRISVHANEARRSAE